MSDTLRPWLADAVAQYRRTHGRNLTFAKKGRLLQVIQFNNYRNTSLPEEKQKDVYAWAHDKAYEVLIRFEAEAINAFEENHESFTSYRYGLFHVLEYKFVLGTDYIAEEPRSANRAQTLPDLPKPRMFYIAVTKFNYISSKGEGNFASHTRKFEELTRKWQIDIELDEEKKRNLVLQTTASQTHAHDAPPSLAEIQAIADIIRAKRRTSGGSSGRSPKRQRFPRSLNLNNVPTIPAELLSTLNSPPVQAADLIDRDMASRPPPENENEAPLEVLPSTPPPPPSSDSTSTEVVSNSTTTATTLLAAVDESASRETKVTVHVVEHATDETPQGRQAPKKFEESAHKKVHPMSSRDTSILVDEVLPPILHVDAPSNDPGSRDNARTAGSPAPVPQGASDTEQTSPRTLVKKRKKAGPLPRFPLDSQDSTSECIAEPLESQDHDTRLPSDSTPRHNKPNSVVATAGSPLQNSEASRTTASAFAEIEIVNNMKPSSQPSSGNVTTPPAAIHALEVEDFYGHSAGPLPAQPTPTIDSISSTTAMITTSSSSIPLEAIKPDTRLHAVQNEDGDSPASSSSDSGKSSDGFEFVSFEQRISNGNSKKIVKVGDIDEVVQGTLNGSASILPDLPSFVRDFSKEGSARSETCDISLEGTSTFQLQNVSQQDLNELMSRLNKSMQRERSSMTAEPARSTGASHMARPGSSSVAWSLGQEKGSTANSQDFVSAKQPTTALAEGSDSPVMSNPTLLARGKFSKTSGSLALGDNLPRSRHSTTQVDSIARPSTSASPDVLDIPSSRRTKASTSALSSGIANSLSRSIASSGRPAQQSHARKAIATIMADIKAFLESKGLTRRQSIDLWYCCSGDLDVACQIADENLAIVRSIQGETETSSDGPVLDTSKQRPSGRVRDAYKFCWTLVDDQAVEDSNPNLFKIARKLLEIESRRGKGSVASRRRFLSENPLAKKLARKVRYPYDDDETN